MKHSLKITLLLLAMFFATQLIGIFVISQYTPEIKHIVNENGTITNQTTYNLPYGMDPPEDITPASTLISIIFALAIAVFLMFFIMKYKVESLLKVWFFVVVTLAIGITVNSLILKLPYSSLIALVIALPLAFLKIFKRGFLAHNLTELIIYPGIASIFVPILNLWSVVLLLILISLYDMYAVWHSGFMQKMAKYQIQKLKIFTGFFVPYVGKKEKQLIQQTKSKKLKDKKVRVSVAILGGGDVVFPLILAGVVLNTWGLIPALLIAIGATLSLAGLFYLSEKGKFYPAMPFLTIGCFIALGIAYFI
jgi:presenilin-like A22 family membrane protease